ncbi:hypothetical protein GQR58_017339 [Nymphon striatum]|nr:hypothetical protein GQR58_017339 [Nymphon striatum]
MTEVTLPWSMRFSKQDIAFMIQKQLYRCGHIEVLKKTGAEQTDTRNCPANYNPCSCKMTNNGQEITCNFESSSLFSNAVMNVIQRATEIISSLYCIDHTSTAIRRAQFGQAIIQRLDIKMPNLNFIHDEAFMNQYNYLERLSFFGGTFERFPIKSINKMVNLKMLYVTGWNNLKRIETDMFGGMIHPESLAYVLFTSCNIKQVGKRAFSNLRNLETLDLSKNKIMSITEHCLPNPNKLHTVIYTTQKVTGTKVSGTVMNEEEGFTKVCDGCFIKEKCKAFSKKPQANPLKTFPDLSSLVKKLVKKMIPLF